MRCLEHKIPPPVIGMIIGFVMWRCAAYGPVFALDVSIRNSVAACLFGVALSCDFAALLAFRAAQTTINPLAPARASKLVTTGIYKITRNPMYLGLCLILLAWALHLSAWLSFMGPVLFVLYITRFQIQPEERVLQQHFGEVYVAYTARVRRWL